MINNMISVVIVAVPLLLVSYCGDNRKMEPVKEENAPNIVAPVSDTELTVDDVIAFELKWVKSEYKIRRMDDILRSYGLPLPDCEQCSNLEQLLIYEKFLEWVASPFVDVLSDKHLYTLLPMNIKGVLYRTWKNDEITKRKLKDIEADFEKKFHEPTPWWWICSVEERIRRLEEINKGGEWYSYSFAAKNRNIYRKGKTFAAYEMWFKRPFPHTRCCDTYRLRQAEKALDVGLPYISGNEYAYLKTKMSADYQKRFKVPMPDYWLSVARVHYSWRSSPYDCDHHVLVTRTVSGGAVARSHKRYLQGGITYSLELDMKNWLEFINALNKLGVNELKQIPLGSYRDNSYKMVSDVLKIFTLDSDPYRDVSGFGQECFGNIETREIVGSVHLLPPNWNEVRKVFQDMETRIEKENERSRKY